MKNFNDPFSPMNILVFLIAYILGIASWYIYFKTSWVGVSKPEDVVIGIQFGILIFIVVACSTTILGFFIDIPGFERFSDFLVKMISFIIGSSLWLCFVGIVISIINLINLLAYK